MAAALRGEGVALMSGNYGFVLSCRCVGSGSPDGCPVYQAWQGAWLVKIRPGDGPPTRRSGVPAANPSARGRTSYGRSGVPAANDSARGRTSYGRSGVPAANPSARGRTSYGRSGVPAANIRPGDGPPTRRSGVPAANPSARGRTSYGRSGVPAANDSARGRASYRWDRGPRCEHCFIGERCLRPWVGPPWGGLVSRTGSFRCPAAFAGCCAGDVSSPRRWPFPGPRSCAVCPCHPGC